MLFWTLEYTPRAGAIISKYLFSKTIFAFTKIKEHQSALRNVWELQTHKTVLILFHPNILFYQCSGSKVGLEVFPELPLLSFILKERLEVELEGLYCSKNLKKVPFSKKSKTFMSYLFSRIECMHSKRSVRSKNKNITSKVLYFNLLINPAITHSHI